MYGYGRYGYFRWPHIFCYPLFVCLFRRQLMKEWLLDVKATKNDKKHIPLFSVSESSATYQPWVCCIIKCVQMLPMALKSVPDQFLSGPFDSYTWGRCWCRRMELKWVAWTDREVNDYCCYCFPWKIVSRVTGWKISQCGRALKQPNTKERCCCFIIGPFKVVWLWSIYYYHLLPVLHLLYWLSMELCLCGWWVCVQIYVSTYVSPFRTVKILMLKMS